MCAGCSDLKISGEASGDERRAALAVRDVKRMVAEGRECVPVVQVGIKHEIVFAAGEIRADLCVVQAGNGGERLDGRRKARFGFTALLALAVLLLKLLEQNMSYHRSIPSFLIGYEMLARHIIKTVQTLLL